MAPSTIFHIFIEAQLKRNNGIAVIINPAFLGKNLNNSGDSKAPEKLISTIIKNVINQLLCLYIFVNRIQI